MSEKLVQQVADQIDKAFADTPYPQGEHIGWDGIDDTLRGKHWRDIPLDIIIRERSELSFLTPAGFRFYLPAFMLAALRHYDEVNTLSGYLVASLSPEPQKDLIDPTKPDYTDWLRKRVAPFKLDEAEAVWAFLKSCRLLHAVDFNNSPYGDLLDGALQFWEAKVNSTAIV